MEMPYAHYEEEKFKQIVHESVVKLDPVVIENEEEKNK